MDEIERDIPLTAIILTKDEADIIAICVNRLARVRDVVIVDSGSMDGTEAAARAARADIRWFHRPFTDFGDQRNWALDHVAPRHDWVLFIDADEYCTSEFLAELKSFLASPDDHVGAFIAGRNYFLGKWLKHSTLYPSYQLRLLKMGQVRYRKEGHGQREVTAGKVCYFRSGWIHDAFSKGVQQWIARHNRYSTDEVELVLRLRSEAVEWRNLASRDPIVRRRALKQIGGRTPFRPLARFFYIYVWRRGFLDGRPGLIYSALRLAHEIHIGAKLAERLYARSGDHSAESDVCVTRSRS